MEGFIGVALVSLRVLSVCVEFRLDIEGSGVPFAPKNHAEKNHSYSFLHGL
ncbi:hypothetical protein [Virgibacillus alimentarius]|uniref:hypothetical protein n=1 Tax=Virgibacillus alimentarius TaxID=698769 RepID=UPI000AFD8B6B|nr:MULTISPECIES: hypothetical protein [Virgibacillus]HLR66632.1 hypothetical protein [Virgibacillus sp.]